MANSPFYIHPTAEVSSTAQIGPGTRIWGQVHVREYALVGAGSVVTRDVPPHTLVFGNPARQHGYVCRCARKISDVFEQNGLLIGRCDTCGKIEFSSSL